ncbi:hypothetical protein BHE74_00049209 [Ensete ventricosum]|nr:hypothetical protein BHE74_00049209 [Ensete ventricosum]
MAWLDPHAQGHPYWIEELARLGQGQEQCSWKYAKVPFGSSNRSYKKAVVEVVSKYPDLSIEENPFADRIEDANVQMDQRGGAASPHVGSTTHGQAAAKGRPIATGAAHKRRQRGAHKGLSPAASPTANRCGGAGRRGGRPFAERLRAQRAAVACVGTTAAVMTA